jgi:hypothetical protein
MLKIAKKLNGAWVSVVIFAIGVSSAFAQASNSSITLCDALGSNCQPGGETFASVANSVIYFISTTIAIPLTAIMVLVGALQITTSAGDPEKFSKGRKTIMYAAIGFAIALIATGVTSIISNLINGS